MKNSVFVFQFETEKGIESFVHTRDYDLLLKNYRILEDKLERLAEIMPCELNEVLDE